LIDQRTPSGNYNPLYDAQGDIIALVRDFTGDDPVNIGDPSGLSGDGCGDGEYCGGVWVGRSNSEHKYGEPIGGSPFEPLECFCLTAGAFNPFTGYECAAYDLARAATK
jgi:hypothetical protein